MRTSNGLAIKKVVLEDGGFNVELRKPRELDPQEGVYATLKFDDGGSWSTRNRQVRDRSLAGAIHYLDTQYGLERRQAAELRLQRQRKIAERSAEFSPHWQEVVSEFGQEG